ncbi:DUF4956 domain-containing protein [Archangium violaceum]|uniref:DUF4956 domain-containing protein n=1 Tax=Archangium violaceum Cb vi76 TaxID=1406225 RepID=A0A084SKG7_9BACT|nr:DUF4956 domain-containing protein [Archangium violaceum]KFA88952.1 hypothetical protein Q664_37875 [Archangium violaceum Cb vi76]
MPPPDALTQASSVSPHILPTLEALLRFSLALVLGSLLAYRPWRRWMPNVPAPVLSTVHTQLLIAVAGAVMTTVIGDSMSRAFGLVGLGGFIRFRSGIKDPRDAAVMFVLIGVGMACGLGAFQIALVATFFLGAVLMILDTTARNDTQWVKLSLDLDDVGAALPPLRALHPGARVVTLEQAPSALSGTAVVEIAMPQRMDGFELLQAVRGALPGVRSASIDPG